MDCIPARLGKPPIIEVVLDVECHLPPGQDLAAMEESALERYADRYPRFRRQFAEELEFDPGSGHPAPVSRRARLLAMQFFSPDDRQLVQVRAQGYSFNRLAPYDGLDAYLPEIERTWRLYVGLAHPVETRHIRLRSINRLVLPGAGGLVDLDDYLKVAPRLPIEEDFWLSGFLHQQVARERSSGNEVSILLQGQPTGGDSLPVVFDITVTVPASGEPDDWPRIADRIHSGRRLKNRVFFNSLTRKCLNLLQPI